MIRALRKEDAAAVARLVLAVNPHQVVTPAVIWHASTCLPERAKRRDWIAEADGEVVGHAHAGFEWSVATPGKGRFWVGVLPGRRGGGIGGDLYARVESYLAGEGAWRLRTWVDGDPAAERFLERRGFERRGGDRVSAVDPRAVDLTELARREADGLRLAALGDVRDRVEELYEVCNSGQRDMPTEERNTEIDLETWKRETLEHPSLSEEGSFVARAGEEVVSVALLTVDVERRLAYNHMTATLPEFRRRGLALLVKLAAARWAAAEGIERLLTENGLDNAGMLAINDRLGYRPLYDQGHWFCMPRGRTKPRHYNRGPGPGVRRLERR